MRKTGLIESPPVGSDGWSGFRGVGSGWPCVTVGEVRSGLGWVRSGRLGGGRAKEYEMWKDFGLP